MASRRTFVKQSALGSLALTLPLLAEIRAVTPGFKSANTGPKISLAQWSLHRTLERGDLKAAHFPRVAKKTSGSPLWNTSMLFIPKNCATHRSGIP